MTVLKIIISQNPTLRRTAQPVTAFTPELQILIDDMLVTMNAAHGVGLAAPQVAQGLRLFVAHLTEDPAVVDAEFDAKKDASVVVPKPAPGVGQVLVMINPVISKLSPETINGTEGCLSIPGFAGTVSRHQSLTVHYLDRKGQRRSLSTFGWMARVIQHEYDHLNGILFTEKASKIWEIEPDDLEESDL